MHSSISSPLVFVLTPRLGDLNHRYLVSATSPPDEHAVQAAFEGRRDDDVLAVTIDVPQKHGRTGAEWLIVRDPRICDLSPARRSVILGSLQSDLATLAPPPVSAAAASSGCVPFPPIDVITRRIDTELGLAKPARYPARSPFLMPFVFAACTALLGTFLYLKIPPSVPRPPGTGNTSPLIPREPTVDQLVERLAADHATEDQVVAAIRGKFAPDLREKATLLEALNHLRPSITQASHDDYQSFADAMKDEPMLAAVRSTLAGTSVDAFMDEETRPQVRDLDPDGFRTLAALLRDSPATNADSERPIYRELERTLMESSKAAQPRRPGDERRITGVFVYEDAKDRLPILLGLFERGGSGELTELGRILVDETQKRPATLADWLEAAAEAHESTGPHAHPWLSRQVLAMHRRQAADPRSRSPGAAKFYEHLDGFLRDCRAAVRTAAPTPPAANPAPPATGSSAQPAAQGGPREPEATSQPR